MKQRALVIAVEHYPESRSTSDHLPGTIANAERFIGCLRNKLGLAEEDIVFCASEKRAANTHGTTRPEILEAVVQLMHAGFDETDRLFVYISGHGVMAGSDDTDVLICSDFVEPMLSGGACLQFDELTVLLSRSLGAGTHFWFIDTCRTPGLKITPTNLGLTPPEASSGTADWYQLLSAQAGQVADNDNAFMDVLLDGLDGNSELAPSDQNPGEVGVTFEGLAKKVYKAFANLNRNPFRRSETARFDSVIRLIKRPGPTATIVKRDGSKSPPVALLTDYDEVLFLGETNAQLPNFIEEAFAERGERPWKRLNVLSIENLENNFREGTSIGQLEAERDAMERYLSSEASRIAQALVLYRYHYVGTYASFWTAADGQRRAHVSAGLLGQNIRFSPSNDFVDFANTRLEIVDRFFQLGQNAIAAASTRIIFQHPDPPEAGT